MDARLSDRGIRVPLAHFAADSAPSCMIVSCWSVANCVSCRLVAIGPALGCTVRALACAARTAAGRTDARWRAPATVVCPWAMHKRRVTA